MKNIKEAEALCTKAVEQVSQSEEALIDNEELLKVTEYLYTIEVEVNQLKNEVKKLQIVEKMADTADI